MRQTEQLQHQEPQVLLHSRELTFMKYVLSLRDLTFLNDKETSFLTATPCNSAKVTTGDVMVGK